VFATDVDGDLDIDVVGTAENDDSVFWFERVDNSNPATFTEHMIAGGTSSITGPDGPSCVIATNIDGLGGVDVIVGAEVTNQIILYSNDGSQNFAAQTMYSAATNVADVFAVQMDGVGGDDVLMLLHRQRGASRQPRVPATLHLAEEGVRVDVEDHAASSGWRSAVLHHGVPKF